MEYLPKIIDEISELISENKRLNDSIRYLKEKLVLAICVNGELEYKNKEQFKPELLESLLNSAGFCRTISEEKSKLTISIDFESLTMEDIEKYFK